MFGRLGASDRAGDRLPPARTMANSTVDVMMYRIDDLRAGWGRIESRGAIPGCRSARRLLAPHLSRHLRLGYDVTKHVDAQRARERVRLDILAVRLIALHEVI